MPDYLKDMRDRERAEGYPVSITKSCEGGPTLCYIKERAKEMGIEIRSFPSCYVGQVCVALKKGTKKQYRSLLKEFGCDYLN